MWFKNRQRDWRLGTIYGCHLPASLWFFANLDQLDVSELGPYVYFLSKEAHSTLG